MSESKAKKRFKNVEIRESDSQLMITLPKGMDEDRAIEELTKQKKEKETVVAFRHEIDTFPLDGAFALSKAIKEVFGFSFSVTEYDMFGNIINQVNQIAFPISATEHAKAPWGKFKVPALVNGVIETSFSAGKDLLPRFVLAGQVRNRDKARIDALVDVVTRMVTVESIYRGKAIQIDFPSDPKQFNPAHAPTFIDTRKVDMNQLVFSKKIEDAIERNLYTLIRHRETCKKLGIPLKRGVLLAGEYGVGKTLLARVVAKLCEQYQWTFVQGKRIDQISSGLKFAKQYEPAVYFDEDIDASMEGDDRDISVNEILNTLDGVVSKSSQIITILTTNHPEKINPAMMRQGRLDFKLEILPPDAEAVGRLVRNYAKGMLHPDVTLIDVGELMAGKNAAAIRETVERSKLEMVRRLGDEAFDNIQLTDHDLATAAQDVLDEDKLCRKDQPDTRSDREKAADIMAAALQKSNKGNGKTLAVTSATMEQ